MKEIIQLGAPRRGQVRRHTRASGLALLVLGMMLALSGCTAPSQKETTQSSAQPDPNVQPGLSRNLTMAAGMPVFNVELIESSSAPLFKNSNVPVALPKSADLHIIGWAIDKAASALPGGVDVAIDGTAWRANLDMDRADVANFFKNQAYFRCGFQFRMHAGAIPPGNHALTIRVISHDGRSYLESLPLKLIID